MSYESRFTQITYDKEASNRQRNLRLKFLALEKFVMESFPPQRTQGAGLPEYNAVVDYCKEQFGDGRGQLAAKLALNTSWESYYQGETIEEVLDNMEIAYMWAGKTIRDEQVKRDVMKAASTK